MKKEDIPRDLAIKNGKQYFNSLKNDIDTLEALEKENDNEAKILLKNIRNQYGYRKNYLKKKKIKNK